MIVPSTIFALVTVLSVAGFRGVYPNLDVMSDDSKLEKSESFELKIVKSADD